MRKLCLIAALLCASIAFAQSNSINYKALIKDANNAVVANQNITVQFSILQGVAQTNVYQETHNPTTDANGIIIVNIGEGTVVSGVFDDIAWASDDHFLNTQINTGSGLVDLGTTGFSAVPYALSAKTAESAENVTGLETIDEGNGNGLVKISRDPANYGNVGSDAVDLSTSLGPNSTLGATGIWSTAMGLETTASGIASTAFGQNTTASGNGALASGIASSATGDNATALGNSSTATGSNSTVIGWQSNATGLGSTALGHANNATGDYAITAGLGTQADAYGSIAVGMYNVGGGNPTSIVPSDPVFEIGNGGGNSSRNNALTVLKNGFVGIRTTAPSQRLDVVGNTELNGNAYILNNGRLGIGTTSPSQRLDVIGNTELNGSAYILNGGRLGIGTSAPSDALVIENGRMEIRGFSNATGTPGTGTIEIGDNLRLSGGRIATNTSTTLNLQLGNNGDLNVDGNTLSVDASANRVGVGTNFPSQALDVVGSAEINGNVIATGRVYGERVAFTGFQNSVISLTGFSLGNYFPTFSDESDVFNAMTSGSGTFTAPRTGLYFFNTSISFSNGDGADDTMWMGFSVNNSTTMNTEIRINPRVDTSPGREQSYSHTSVIQLSTGQTVRVMIRSVNSATTIQILERTFTGYYLGDL